MAVTVEELKTKIVTLEKSVGSSLIPEALKAGMKGSIEKLKAQLLELEGKAEVKVEKAEEKIEEAEKKIKQADTKAEKKEAVAELKDAKEEKKEGEAEVKAIEKAAEKVDKVTAKVHGGTRKGAGRKAIPRMPKEKGQRGGKRIGAGRKVKATSTTKMVKPKGYKPRKDTPVFVKRTVVKKAEKVKSVRAFGQKVEYKNDSEFCSKLISAFKRRRAVSKKLGKKKTRPVFGVITSHIKDAVTRAIDNTPKKTIEANPKAFLAKAQRLEKSAINFLEDFKAILGSDFKKSEISAEFGDLEKSIKKLVSKYKK